MTLRIVLNSNVGDSHLLDLRECRRVRIVPPAVALKEIEGRRERSAGVLRARRSRA